MSEGYSYSEKLTNEIDGPSFSAGRTQTQCPATARGLARGSKGLALAARSLAAKIRSFELTDPATADLAGRWRQEIDAQERKVVEWFAPAKQAAFKAHAAICRQEKDALAQYREARRVINTKLAAWQEAQVHRLVAADEPPTDSHSGTESAFAAECAPRVEGVTFRENWRTEVIDKVAFVNAIAARPELANLVDPNLTALGHLARAHKSALDIPGVRVWCELSVAASRHL
jgi:hypothetical protein